MWAQHPPGQCWCSVPGRPFGSAGGCSVLQGRRDALLRGCPRCWQQSSRGPRVTADKPRARRVPWRPWGRAEVFLCPQVCQHHPQPALPHPCQPVGRRAAGPGPAARQLPAQPRNRECRGSWGSSRQGWGRVQPGKVLPGGIHLQHALAKNAVLLQGELLGQGTRSKPLNWRPKQPS